VSAAEFEARQLADLVNSNPQMADGKEVFHDDHANLVDPSTANTIAADLSEARKLMRRQTSVDGQVIVNLVPQYLLVSADRETEAEKVVAEIAPAKVEDSNAPWRSLQVVVEPRLADDPWYLVAADGSADGLEYAYLSTGAGPQTATEAGFDYDGVRVRVFEDFGAGWVDFRSWVKHPGSGQ
jgi:hypothetical protein